MLIHKTGARVAVQNVDTSYSPISVLKARHSPFSPAGDDAIVVGCFSFTIRLLVAFQAVVSVMEIRRERHSRRMEPQDGEEGPWG
jgi:hypothetical protein